MDQLLAAVDLGSNSFRLSIGRVEQHNGHAQIYAVDRLNESVRLAAQMGPDKRIHPDAVKRAVTILKRFNERIAGFHPNRVRVVATNTFRVATNKDDMLAVAEEALGFPIEVISGYEEARLIYAGVNNALPPSSSRRLMVDIGGGSTEIIIGRNNQPQLLSSLAMGCVSYTDRFFSTGLITDNRMNQAIWAARREIEVIAQQYRKNGWQQAYGSSGTAKGIEAILLGNGYSSRGITLEGLNLLRKKLIRDKRVIAEDLAGIKPHRIPVLAAGLAIMIAIFEELKIEMMQLGEGALRMGVLYDLLGRDSDRDKREETVLQLSKRYNLDQTQAFRVKQAALTLFKQFALSPTPDHKDLEKALGWAADLHEVGLSIAHNDYHKHTAYVLEHADMPGFSRDDQALLAFLTIGQLGRLDKLKNPPSTNINSAISKEQWLTLLCLRLGVMLMRRREEVSALPLKIKIDQTGATVYVDKNWITARPLSEFSLRTEQREWAKAGIHLKLIYTNRLTQINS